MVKEETGELKAVVFLRNQNRIEEQRQVAQNIRHMEGKMKGGSTTKVTIKDVNDNSTESLNKLYIERALARGNKSLGHQTEMGIQLLTPVFIDSLGNYGEGTSVEYVLLIQQMQLMILSWRVSIIQR